MQRVLLLYPCVGDHLARRVREGSRVRHRYGRHRRHRWRWRWRTASRACVRIPRPGPRPRRRAPAPTRPRRPPARAVAGRSPSTPAPRAARGTASTSARSRRSREHAALHRLRAQHPERAPEGARPGRVPVRALPRNLQRRRRRSTPRTRRARRSTTGRASTRSTTPSSRRACTRSSRSASRPARWRPMPDADPDAALVQQQVAQHQPADRREASDWSKWTALMRAVRAPPRGALRRRRGPRQLVLRGLERALVDVRAGRRRLLRALPEHRGRACSRATRGYAWAGRRARRASRRR